MAKKSNAHQCVNLHAGKSSHLLLTHTDSVPKPVVLAIIDLMHRTTITFSVLETTYVDDHRAFVRFRRETSAAPTGVAPSRKRRSAPAASASAAAGPTDGLLSITLIDDEPGDPSTVTVPDTPVDYVDDPNAPDDTTPSP